ncbi:MAG: hypothetical protein P4M09_07740 [Devosia sp.]|nr:hypothetical protein [Devosia sp.]
MTSSSELVDIDVVIKHRTPKAVLIDHPDSNSEDIWLPLSAIEIEETGRFVVTVTLPRLLAEEKGLC